MVCAGIQSFTNLAIFEAMFLPARSNTARSLEVLVCGLGSASIAARYFMIHSSGASFNLDGWIFMGDFRTCCWGDCVASLISCLHREHKAPNALVGRFRRKISQAKNVSCRICYRSEGGTAT